MSLDRVFPLAGACAVFYVSVLAGCGGTDEPMATQFYRPTGSLQCAPTRSTQANLNVTVATLTEAGASVKESSCALDGNAHVAVCGADTGAVFLITVAAGSEQVAQSLGFRFASEIPSARVVTCS